MHRDPDQLEAHVLNMHAQGKPPLSCLVCTSAWSGCMPMHGNLEKLDLGQGKGDLLADGCPCMEAANSGFGT